MAAVKAIKHPYLQTLYGFEGLYFQGPDYQCGLSIPCSIAEWFERGSQRECVTFLNYARGSCAELRTQISIGIEIGYVPKEIGQAWGKEAKEISSMLSSLIKTKKRFIQQSES